MLALSTIGFWPRAFRWSNVRQFYADGRELLARIWAAGGGAARLGAPLSIHVDSTICKVDGRGEQCAGFG